MERLQSEIIRSMRFPLIVMVVMSHSMPHYQLTQWSFSNAVDFSMFFTEMLTFILCPVAVPCFFLISGYFFFKSSGSFDIPTYVGKLRKRIMTLLVPYILWNVLSVLGEMVRSFAHGSGFVFPDLLYCLWTGPANYPFWYVRDLIALVLLSPVFFQYFSRSGAKGWLVFFLLYLIVPKDFSLFSLSIRSAFYFGTGAFMGINGKNLLAFCMKHTWCAVVFLPLCIADTWFIHSDLIHYYLFKVVCMTGVITLFLMMYYLRNKERVMSTLSKLSVTVFFIYGAHLVQIEGLFKGFVSRTAFFGGSVGIILGYILITFGTVSACLFLYYAMSKLAPRLLGLLVGRKMEVKI